MVNRCRFDRGATQQTSAQPFAAARGIGSSFGWCMQPFRFGLLLERFGESASVDQQVDTVRTAAADRFASLELSVFATAIAASDRRAAPENLARLRRWTVSPEDVLAMPTLLIGTVEQMAEDLERRRDEYAISYIVVRDGQLADVLPLVQRLANT
jgi:alkanesulfonate monooxygenase SsuD/methylene tetrahydromethanopterin reductase-like flavin-dependent oxidoreductase (luciferase family)